MSYPSDIDEIPESEILQELGRRHALRAKGVCDYCERKPATYPCKFPERHRPDKPEPDYSPLSEESKKKLKEILGKLRMGDAY